MPRIARLYIIQVIIGFGLSTVFVGLLLYLNVGKLWYLVSHTSGGLFALSMLWFLNGVVFAGVQFGISVMQLADDNNSGGGAKHDVPVHDTEPVSVAVTARVN
ncbi:hypothetical protein ACMAZE_06330 [Pseudopelagicola sp. nBUS_20]|uniref:hypothetical protein n=1 Tax=Pseudopelagicola sp. nBUS_20 TaxID=3395317 RepID=UPI003EB98B41